MLLIPCHSKALHTSYLLTPYPFKSPYPNELVIKTVYLCAKLKHVATEKCLDVLDARQYKEHVLGVYSCHKAHSIGYTQVINRTYNKPCNYLIVD